MKIVSATLICGAVLFVANTGLQAQSGPTTTPAPVVSASPSVAATPKDIGPAEAWSAKPVGKYDLIVNIPQGAMPVELTISESANGLSALFYKVGDNDAHLMTATVKDTDLILVGHTETGAVTITLRHHGAKLAGVWQLGNDQGTVEGSTKS
jgi:hypothetical protein